MRLPLEMRNDAERLGPPGSFRIFFGDDWGPEKPKEKKQCQGLFLYLFVCQWLRNVRQYFD